jgi:hypothetical protein
MKTCGIAMTTAEKVAAHMATRTTKELIGDLVMSGIMLEADPKLYDRMPTVRGWIMDELKRRDPAAYDAWLDSETDDDGLFRYYHC